MTPLTGTRRLVRLGLRRDRVQLPVWIAGTLAFLYASLSATATQYPTDADRAAVLKTAVQSPALLFLRSTPTGADAATMVMFQMLPFLVVMAGLMSTFAVVRHTRQEEETGRAEMIGATVVGRYALLTAALVVAAIADAALGLVVTLALVGYGHAAAGSVAAGLAVALGGMAFAGLAAVAAQVMQTSRAANGLASAAVGVAYVLRGIGDATGTVNPDGYTMTTGWVTWLSPIGWSQLVHPYAGDRWWVLLLPLATVVAAVAAAFALTRNRDVGLGMIPPRPGPATARPALLSALGLAWRLQRGVLVAWLVTLGLFGLVLGSLGNTVRDAFQENATAGETLTNLGGRSDDIADSFFGAIMAFVGFFVAAYVVSALLRLRGEEAGGHAEPVLATATGRLRWLGGHLVVAVAGAAAMLLVTGAATGLVYGQSVGEIGHQVTRMTAAALVQLPPVLVVGAFVVLVFGLLPRLTVGLAWTALALSLVAGQLAAMFDLPQAVRDLSPFSHVPVLPVAEFRAVPVLVLVAVAAALLTAGAALFRRRDLVL